MECNKILTKENICFIDFIGCNKYQRGLLNVERGCFSCANIPSGMSSLTPYFTGRLFLGM